MKNFFSALILALTLTACGGGTGTESPPLDIATVEAAQESKVDATTTVEVLPATPEVKAVCKGVDIFLFGDSTQEIAYSWAILDLVNQKCPGSTIKNFGMGGQDSRQALAGLLPLNTVTYDQPGITVPTFEQNLAALPNTGRQRIVVTNWGINSFWHGVTDPSVVLNDMVRIHALIVAAGMTPILETPNPIFGGYINEVAAVAAMERGLGYPLIDQFATCAAMGAGCQAGMGNGGTDLVHPGPALLANKAAASAAVIIQQAK